MIHYRVPNMYLVCRTSIRLSTAFIRLGGRWIVATPETAYAAEFVQLASQQLAKLAGAAIEQKRVEQLLGLSQGYLSHVKASRHAPSPMLVAELVLLAKAPERRLKELEAFWKRRAA
jgi:hypothetical protein